MVDINQERVKTHSWYAKAGGWLLVWMGLMGLGVAEAAENPLVASRVPGTNQISLNNLGITIYSQNMGISNEKKEDIAAIHEVRRLQLVSGENRVTIEGLSSTILPESFFIHILDPELNVEIEEQFFSGDPFLLGNMFSRSMGKDVLIRQSASDINRSHFHRGRLLAVVPQVVVEEEGTIFSVLPEQIVFLERVAALKGNPSLSIRMDSPKAQEVLVEINYLAKGIGWQAYYIGELNENESSLNIDGWVSIVNNSEGDYPDAHVQLSAQNPLGAGTGFNDPESTLLYRIEKPVTLAAYQEKKVRLFRIINLPLTLDYRLKAGQDFSQNLEGQEVPVAVEKWGTLEKPLEFRNIIPEGQLRLYKRNNTEAIEFLGETHLRERGGRADSFSYWKYRRY